MGIVIRGGVARGAPDDWEGRSYYMVSNDDMRRAWDDANLDELADGMGRTAFMLRFTLSHPALDTTIVGTSSFDHLRSNIATALEGPLPDDVMDGEASPCRGGAGGFMSGNAMGSMSWTSLPGPLRPQRRPLGAGSGGSSRSAVARGTADELGDCVQLVGAEASRHFLTSGRPGRCVTPTAVRAIGARRSHQHRHRRRPT
jgi:hypothetical protein